MCKKKKGKFSNTTLTRPMATEASTQTTSPPSPPTGIPRGPRKRHEHITTSDAELKEFNKEYNAKAQSQYMDPCRAQTKASMKCMDENNYDKKRCTRFFKDYSDCKKKWVKNDLILWGQLFYSRPLRTCKKTPREHKKKKICRTPRQLRRIVV